MHKTLHVIQNVHLICAHACIQQHLYKKDTLGLRILSLIGQCLLLGGGKYTERTHVYRKVVIWTGKNCPLYRESFLKVLCP